MNERQEEAMEQQDFENGSREQQSNPATGSAEENSQSGATGETNGTSTVSGATEGGTDDALETARKEIQELKDQWTRERAEFVNYRKRTQEEMARSRVFAIVNFVKDLLPVIDNLDLVLRSKSDSPEVQNFVTGVEMIRNEFFSVLSRENIKPVVHEGDEFDPTFMEALDLAEDPSATKDVVKQVYEKGWIREVEEGTPQVIRPARVQVAKAVARGAASDSDEKASVTED